MNRKFAIQNAINRYTLVQAGTGSGSGVIVGSGIVLSCFHCLSIHEGVKVDGREATILGVDPLHDLVMLSVETIEVPPILLGVVSLGDRVLSVGNPMGLEGSLILGNVVHTTENEIYHDSHGLPGVSGSGLFNYKGELVGMNQACLIVKNFGAGYTIALPSRHMRDIFSQVFRIVQPTQEEVARYAGDN